MNYFLLFLTMSASAMITVGTRLYRSRTAGCADADALYNILVPASATLGWLILFLLDPSFDLGVLPYAVGYGAGYTCFTLGMLGALKNGPTSVTALVKQLALVGVSVFGFILCILASLPLIFGGISAIVDVVLLGVIYTAASIINTSMLSIYPLRYAETGNVASVSGIMDLATYMGAGVTGIIFGAVIAASGYVPMFAAFAVISLVSIVLLLLVDRYRKKQATAA